VELAKHFTILVYPFYHNFPRHGKPDLLNALDKGWQFWMNRLNAKDQLSALDNTFFFLPYVRALLFPETSQITSEPVPDIEGNIGEWLDFSLPQIVRRVPEHAVIHLTYKPELMEILNKCELVAEGKLFSAPLELCWIDLMIFPQRIGFLIIKVLLREEKPDINRFNDLLGFIRRIHPAKIGFELPVWRFPNQRNPIEITSARLLDYLLQGLVDESPVNERLRSLDEFLFARPQQGSGNYTESPLGQTYGEVFQLYSYGCQDQAIEPELSAQKTPVIALPSSSDQTSGCDTFFATPFQKSLYEIATCTRVEEADERPDGQQVESLFNSGLINFWDNWQALALTNNIFFLGKYKTVFTMRYLPENAESDYLPLYLYVLYQKTRLSIMFGALMETEKNPRSNLKRARQLWQDFLKFQNHYWFTEVTHKPQGMAIYHILQKALGVQPLYNQQSEEVHALRDFYEAKTQRETNRMINFLTFVGVPLGILSQVYGSVLIKEANWVEPLIILGIYFIALWLLWRFWFMER
jgi:hypothetical protein